jgi:flagellar protein FlaG
MNVDTIGSPGGMSPQPPKAAEAIDSARKSKDSLAAEPQAATDSPKIQPEELLDQIKSLTQDGQYSVRFEKGDEMSELVVKIFDNETHEVIRQIPAEELLNFKATFEELVGNLVNTKG